MIDKNETVKVKFSAWNGIELGFFFMIGVAIFSIVTAPLWCLLGALLTGLR